MAALVRLPEPPQRMVAAAALDAPEALDLLLLPLLAPVLLLLRLLLPLQRQLPLL